MKLRDDIKVLRNSINKLKIPKIDYKVTLDYLRAQITETKQFHEASKEKLSATRDLFEGIKKERTEMFKKCLTDVVEFVKDWFKLFESYDNVVDVKCELLNEDEPYLDGIIFSANRNGNIFVPISEMDDDVKNLFGMALLTLPHW